MKKIIILFISILLVGCYQIQLEDSIKSTSLVWWAPNRYTHVNNMAKSRIYETLLTVTNSNIIFIHPPKGENRERFLTLFSQNQLQ